jgi:hypothetical protein
MQEHTRRASADFCVFSNLAQGKKARINSTATASGGDYRRRLLFCKIYL